MILLIDDDRAHLDNLVEVLDDAGHETRRASSGEEALRILATERPCLILLDLSMPGINGWMLLQMLASTPRLASVPVCIVTGTPEAAPSGVACTLAKPVHIDDLLATVAAYC